MFIVIEIQSTGDNVSTIVNKHDTLPEAQQKYHNILAAAAVSKVPIHTAMIIEPTGNTVRVECFAHAQETEVEE